MKKAPSFDRLEKSVNKDNDRVGYEWESLLKKDHTEQDRIDLAGKQADRFKSVAKNCGFLLEEGKLVRMTPEQWRAQYP